MRKSFLALAALAVLSCAASAATAVTEKIVSACRVVHGLVCERVTSAVAVFSQPEHLPAPPVKFVQAGAYVLRQAKRERPTVTPRWRMCPSA